MRREVAQIFESESLLKPFFTRVFMPCREKQAARHDRYADDSDFAEYWAAVIAWSFRNGQGNMAFEPKQLT